MEKVVVVPEGELVRNQIPVQLDEGVPAGRDSDPVQAREPMHRFPPKVVTVEEPEWKPSPLAGLVGECAAMQYVFDVVQRVAASELPVLITGENGTGKEQIARCINALSLRAGGPFVPVICGAVPKPQLEAELFGVERGVGTGGAAAGPVTGKIESARNGTLFLDEVSELPQLLQVKLLRFLQDGKLQKVGTREEVEVDARIVCASSRDLAQAMRDGALREDLYYKIGAITVELPPLRARGKDIMLLAHHFLKRWGAACQRKVRGFTSAAVSLMESHSWPGNIPELEHRVQRGVLMTDAPLLKPEALGFVRDEPARELTCSAPKLTLKEARDQVEKGLVVAALDASAGNLVKASQQLGVSRPTLYDLMKKHGLGKVGG